MKRLFYSICIILLAIGCEEIVSVADISEEFIEVLAPSNNAILEEGSITFSWEELEFADQYQLQIATPSFEMANQVILDTIVGDSTQAVRNISFNLSPENYQWRIRGLNSEFATSYTTQNLIIEAASMPLADQTVVILSPEDNLETSETSIQFSWELIEEATLYRIQVIDLADDTIVQEETTEFADITLDLTSGMYQWQVRAENDTENSPYSSQLITIL